MTVSTIFIFGWIVAGQFISHLHWSIILVVVMCVWSCHFNEGTSCIPKYTYGSFWCHIRSGWFLYFMFWFWIFALNAFEFVFDLLGQLVIAHFVIPWSIPAHSQYLSSLFSCICIA